MDESRRAELIEKYDGPLAWVTIMGVFLALSAVVAAVCFWLN